MTWTTRNPILTFLIAGALCLGFAIDDARAGTYGVSQCDASTGAGMSPQWTANTNGSWPAQDLCPGGMQVAGNGADGVFAQWILFPPTGVTISSVVFGGQGNGTSQVPVYALLCATEANPICSWSDYEDMSGVSQIHTLTAPGSVSMRFGMGSTCCTHYSSAAYSSIWNLAFTLSESTPPSLGVPTGNVNINGWNRGNLNAGISATDSESGVKQLLASVDSNPVGPGSVSHALSCSNLQIVPCPTSAPGWSPTVATNALADGAHTLRYSASDYASNSSQSAIYSFKVDNTAPGVPTNVQTPGMNGWNAANDFDLTWTNGTEDLETATQSGIAAVKIDVDPAIAGPTDPAAVTIPIGTTVGGVSATHNSLSNLTVPAIGAYKIKLAVVDKAGNQSPVGDGTHGAIDSIFPIGYDPNPPVAPQGQNNGWISRAELAGGFVQQWAVVSTPNTAPICGYAKSITAAPADPGAAINLAGAVNSFVLPADLTEGQHSVNVRSVNCSGIASVPAVHIAAPVDLTDPVGAITGVAPDEWYKDNLIVHLTGTDALSGMAPSATTFIPDGAYLSYSLNGGSEQLIAAATEDVAVVGEGMKQLAFSAVDFAGNKSATKTVSFGIDASKPIGAFNVPDPNRPTLISAPMHDPVSGIALATVQIRNLAGGDWTTLPTAIADDQGNGVAGFPKDAKISARFPDTSLPAGEYSVRLTGVDRAGNWLVTTQRSDGKEMTIVNPLRESVSLSAGLSKAKRTCGRKKGVKCVKKFRGKVVFSSTYPVLTVGFKRGAVVQGFLTTNSYGALSRQPIEVFAKTRTGTEALIGSTSTKSDGSYVFRIKPGVSRSIRVYFPGTEMREDASTTVRLGTAAKLSMRASTKHSFTGKTVTFQGKVRSFDGAIPAAGKIVALQFYAGKKWRPAVAIAHTDKRGNFRVKYKFDGPRLKARIVFRVFAPTEDGWDHVASASRRLTLRLN